jgi:hypothetical protein
MPINEKAMNALISYRRKAIDISLLVKIVTEEGYEITIHPDSSVSVGVPS